MELLVLEAVVVAQPLFLEIHQVLAELEVVA
jgi:hypothetical protein